MRLRIINETDSLCICCWKFNVGKVYNKPNITYAVSVLGRFQLNLGKPWKAAKIVMRDLHQAKTFIIMFSCSGNIRLVG